MARIKVLQVFPCFADPERIRFIAEVDEDISELLPYMNAIVKGAIYNPNFPSLTVRHEGALVTIYPKSVKAGLVRDEEHAREIIGWLEGLIEHCKSHMDSIEPLYERRSGLFPLDVYKLLPGTNCGECGEMTCLAFASKLFKGERSVEECRPLFSSELYSGKRERLLELLEAAGYPVPSQGR